MKNIVILGSTGSIGTQTLDIVRALPELFKVIGLSAGYNLTLLKDQIREFQPRMVYCASESHIEGTWTLPEEMASDQDVDLVMVASTGKVGLKATLAALRNGKSVALSNKEVIVMAGELVIAAAEEGNGIILPVDSEPSAIWQCMRGEGQPVRRLFITASGGPFRSLTLSEKNQVTPEQALRHPTWVMGRKITVDSATLMNKGFEVIESHWLFNMPFEKIEVLVHAQSVIHSMVEFADGSVKAQMGPPDMRLPIQCAMSYPDRVSSDVIPIYNPLAYPSLTFEKLDFDNNPCFPIALEAGQKGGTYPAVLSAADEEAVHAFLKGKINFGTIHELLNDVLDSHEPMFDVSLESILFADEWARDRARQFIARSG